MGTHMLLQVGYGSGTKVAVERVVFGILHEIEGMPMLGMRHAKHEVHHGTLLTVLMREPSPHHTPLYRIPFA